MYGKGPAAGPQLHPSYDSWANNTLPTYHVGQQFEPTELQLNPGHTAAPALLTETDLLQLMENNQIGTDATQAGSKRGQRGQSSGPLHLAHLRSFVVPGYSTIKQSPSNGCV